MSVIRIVPCPKCGKGARWQGNPARPFCSPRCREIDMAAWYTESYHIPVEGGSEDATEDNEISEGETTARDSVGLSNIGSNE